MPDCMPDASRVGGSWVDKVVPAVASLGRMEGSGLACTCRDTPAGISYIISY
jgi:hypothetical protein